jgi:uncharacterized pyridoxamine 5'-phosphate oxidase family protein
MTKAITAIADLKNRRISSQAWLKFFVSTAHIGAPKTIIVQYVIYLLLLSSKKFYIQKRNSTFIYKPFNEYHDTAVSTHADNKQATPLSDICWYNIKIKL